MARPDRKGFRVRLEGVQIHHALEAAVGQFGQQPRTARETACRCWAARRARFCFSFRRNFRPTPNGWPSFFKLLSKKRRYSFEFRHPSWYAPRIRGCSSDQNISLCISDHHDAPAPWKRTADFVYVRGHGPGGPLQRPLQPGHVGGLGQVESSRGRKQGCDVFVYFDNDQKSAAPADALKLSRCCWSRKGPAGPAASARSRRGTIFAAPGLNERSVQALSLIDVRCTSNDRQFRQTLPLAVDGHDGAPSAGRLDGDKILRYFVVGSGIAGISTAYELAIEGQTGDRRRPGTDRRRHHGAHQRPSGAALRRPDIGHDQAARRGHFPRRSTQSQAAAVDRIEADSRAGRYRLRFSSTRRLPVSGAQY